ncbi:hypothetical protein DFP74_5782 [Nocardiopsis sp. Huas11]|uniref:hypothetical protein n=1 Tax=Nocardiopsis sp. Huas11 TaxID=2183912 RepID=UPI000EAF731A|nr:hypothetical protein [Nocardiopsis sp. Huas11]RKS10036.1 hypothetical protein DFP74_5782 [Nocardiopsis sp. Huas11]
MSKKHITADSRAAEQRRREVTQPIGDVFVSGGLQLDSPTRANYPNKVAREVRRLGGDPETVETAKRWAAELAAEVEADPTHQGLTAARASAAACADTIASRVHETAENGLNAERQGMSPDEITEAVEANVRPGGARARAREAASQAPAAPEGPPTEERRRVVDAVNGRDRAQARQRRHDALGEDTSTTMRFADGTIRRGGES